ncbi:bromodomain-containing protein 4-like [Armigeres subalbatus]|uniref:bromodomain-containing protein 4-like n=1 Tax=Armigeres subalbatus TaxID=124917 RepID=UPI002ED53E69
MDPEFEVIVSPRQLRHSPERISASQNSSQRRGLRPPGQVFQQSRIPPPTTMARSQPHETPKIRPPSMIRPPSGGKFQTPQNIQISERIRPPSGLKPPGFIKPPSRSTPIGLSSSMQKVIPLPGPSKILAQIPRPSRVPATPVGVSRIPAPGTIRVPSTSLLPKPSFIRSQSLSKIVPPSRIAHAPIKQIQQRAATPQRSSVPTRVMRPSSAPTAPASKIRVQIQPKARRPEPMTPKSQQRIRGPEPMTPVRRPKVQLPRTAVKKRVETEDKDAEVYSIAGREVEFVDWAPSPDDSSQPQTSRRTTSKPGGVRIVKAIAKPSTSRRNVPDEPKTPVSVRGAIPKTPTGRPKIHLPRTAAKQRLTTEDSDAEIYHIAGRDVKFVDWVPSPEEQPAHQPVRRSVVRPGGARIRMAPRSDDSPEGATLPPPIVEAMRAVRESRKIHEFADEPSVAAAKEFAVQLDADIQRFKGMGADMSELKQRKADVLSKLRTMYDQDRRDEEAIPDVEAFRMKYGVTQSPRMRQLLEVTGDWNQAILDRQELAENIAQAQPFVPQEKPKLTAMMQGLVESPERIDQADRRRSELEQARQERIDNYKQRKEADQEYRRILEERRKNLPSRRPYTKQEREDIRQRYHEAQEWTYTAPTEEELDNALRMAEMMELEDAGLSVAADPEKTVETLFPDAAPLTECSGAVDNVPIPKSIPVEEINNMNDLDRSTAEIALKASLVPVPAEGVTKKVLESGLHDMETAKIKPAPQKLDPMYEIDLKLGQPKRKNFIQLQGSSVPSWFPGYFSIFPGAPGLIKAMKSPSITLLNAFRQMHSSAAI